MNPFQTTNSWIALVLFLYAQTSSAAIGYLHMKGIHSLFTPECEYLSPIRGVTSLKTQVLPNIRFWGAYGKLNSSYGCHPQIIRASNQGTDCPQDFTSAWIQKLFPSPDGVNFVANQGSSDDPFSKLTPESIGKLLSIVHKYYQNQQKLSAFEEKEGSAFDVPLPEDAQIYEIYKSIFGKPQISNQQKQQINRNRKKLISIRSQLESCEGENRVQDLLKTLDAVQKEIEKIEFTGLKSTKKWQQLSSSVQTMLGALHENPKSPYPKGIVEQTLLGYAWEQATGKENFANLAKELPKECIEPAHDWIYASSPLTIRQELTKKHWLKESFNKDDYKNWLSKFSKGLPTSSQIAALKSNPELAAFYAYSFESQKRLLPPIAGYKGAAHESLGKSEGSRKYNTYPDCGETSLRNFINIIIFNGENGRFDKTILNIMKAKHELEIYEGKSKDRGLFVFYEDHKNSDPNYVDDYHVHDDWSGRVASELKGVKYLKGGGQCEIGAGIANIQSTIASLLGDSALDSGSDQGKKWDRICELASRPGFQLRWRMKEGKANDNLGVVEFSINWAPAFDWHFNAGHFWINPVDDIEADWRAKIDNTEFSIDVDRSWFRDKTDFNSVSHAKDFWNRNLKSTEVRFKAIDSALGKQIKNIYPIIRGWMQKYSENDLNAQAKILNSISGAPAAAQDFSLEVKRALSAMNQDRTLSSVTCIENNLGHSLRELNLTAEELTKGKDSEEPLIYRAARSNKVGILKEIAESKDPQIQSTFAFEGKEYTPLHLVVNEQYRDGTDVLKMLLQSGNHFIQRAMSMQDQEGKTPLHSIAAYAYRYEGYKDILRTLARSKDFAEAFTLESKAGGSPLHSINDPEVFQALLESKDQKVQTAFSKPDGQGRTLAHNAALGGNVEILEFVHEHFPQILTFPDKQGKPPAHLAVVGGNEDAILFFIKNAPQSLVSLDYSGETPAHTVAPYNPKVLLFLAKNFPLALKVADQEGRTPIDLINSTHYSKLKDKILEILLHQVK